MKQSIRQRPEFVFHLRNSILIIKYKYSVKVVNPLRRSMYTVKRLESLHRFNSRDELLTQMSEDLGTSVDQVGYIEHGHGLRV